MASFEEGAACVAAPASKGDSYARKVKSAIKANGRPVSMRQGVMSRLASGSLVLNVSGGLEESSALYAKLCRQDGNEGMPNISVVEVQGGKAARASRVDNIAEEARFLQGEGRGVFCIVASKDQRPPQLLLGTDKDALSARVDAAAGVRTKPVRTLYGQVKVRDGVVSMRSKLPVERLASLVESFVSAHSGCWPEVEVLRNARLSTAG